MDYHVTPRTVGTEKLLLAHSMGGAIGVHYLAQNPGVFSKAFLNAPMLQINTNPYPEKLAKLIAASMVASLQGSEYAPGWGPYVPEEYVFENNPYTHSSPRFENNKKIFLDHPELVVWGPTARWVNESLKATKNIQKLAKEINIPMVIVQSGIDEIVKPRRQNKFCHKAKQCDLMVLLHAHHEMLMETDFFRNQVLRKMHDLFNI
jgi:lysophospholipase